MTASNRYGLIAALALATAAVLAAPGAPGSPAHAQTTKGTAMTGTAVPLSPNMVERFIASYPDFKDAANRLNKKYGSTKLGNNPIDGFKAANTVQAAQAELSQVARRHGFEGYNQWLQVAQSVVTAYAFAKGGGEVDSQIARTIEQVRSNPQMSAEQKQMVIQQLQASTQSMAAIRPPPENAAAVAPFADRLRGLFEAR